MDGSNNNTNSNNRQRMNMPKPNLNWLYIIIVTALVALMFMNQGTDVSKTASYTEFKKYVSMGYATKIVANKDELTLQMYVKPEYAKEVFKTNLNQLGRSPFITVEFGSIDALEKFLDEQQQQKHFTGTVNYEKKNDFFGALFWNIVSIGLLIFLWLFLMRRMSGGVGGGGVFNVGKSKAQLFDKT